MRKRLARLVLPCALLLLLMPGQVLATSSFVTTIERDTCVAGAGKYGYGQGVLRVRVIEYGKSGATKFTFVAQVWHEGIHSATWSMEYQWPNYSYSFPDDKNSYYNSRQFAYAPNHNAYHKIVVRVRALDANGGTLYTKLIQGKTC